MSALSRREFFQTGLEAGVGLAAGVATRARSGPVTDDPMEAAYFGVYIWKQAVEKAKSTEVDAVRKAVYGQEFLAPGGKIKMHENNHHTYKPVLIGEILKDGQFKIVTRTKGLVEPEPWSKYTSPDKGCDWVSQKGTYQKKA